MEFHSLQLYFFWSSEQNKYEAHCGGGKEVVHCGGGNSSGESPVGGGGTSAGGDDPKSKFGKTPGGLSRILMESNWLESPTTSAHP